MHVFHRLNQISNPWNNSSIILFQSERREWNRWRNWSQKALITHLTGWCIYMTWVLHRIFDTCKGFNIRDQSSSNKMCLRLWNRTLHLGRLRQMKGERNLIRRIDALSRIRRKSFTGEILRINISRMSDSGKNVS